MINRPFREKAGYTLLSMMLLSQGHAASSLLYGVDTGIGESDNVTLVQDHKVSQTIAALDADFQYQQQSRLLDIDARGNFSDLNYLQGAYGNEFLGRFDGLGKLAILPGRLSWDLQDSFGQQQLDPFAPVTPGNQEHVNYLSTGPEMNLRLGYTGFVNGSVHYTRVDYQTSPYDSNRFSGDLAVGRQLSAASSVSLEGTTERVLFTEKYVDGVLTNVDYTRSSVFGHYELAGARTSVLANLGATLTDEQGNKSAGPLARLSLARKLSTAATLTFTAERDVTDASTSFAGLQGGGAATLNAGTPITGVPNSANTGLATTPSAQTTSNYTINYATVAWNYVRNRTTLNAAATYEKDRYSGDEQLDLHRVTASAGIEREFTHALSGQLQGQLYRSVYDYTEFAQTDWSATAALIYRVGRALEFKLRYDHVAQTASGFVTGLLGAVNGVGNNYGENRVFLTIGYRPRTRTALAPNLRNAPAVLGTPVTQPLPLDLAEPAPAQQPTNN